MTDDRGQRTEDREQKTENTRQMANQRLPLLLPICTLSVLVGHLTSDL